MADTPAVTVDHSLCDPKRCGIGTLGDCIVKDPLDRFVVLLQALVEQAEMADGGRIGECPAGFWWWRWRAVTRTTDGRIELVVRADGGETVLLSHDAVCLADVGREELV